MAIRTCHHHFWVVLLIQPLSLGACCAISRVKPFLPLRYSLSSKNATAHINSKPYWGLARFQLEHVVTLNILDGPSCGRFVSVFWPQPMRIHTLL